MGNDDPGSIWRKWIRQPRSPAQDSLTLYVNGIELPGSFQNEVRPVATGGKSGLPAESYLFHFKLTRNESDSTNVKAWKKLLGTLNQWGNGEASLSIGFKFYLPIPLDPPVKISVFTASTPLWFILSILGALIALVALARGAWMRDVGWEPKATPGESAVTWVPCRMPDAAFSLSRTQFATWFVLITAGTLYLCVVTGEPVFPPKEMIILLGFATATAGGGWVVDRSSADARKDRYASLLKQRTACMTGDADTLSPADKAKCDWLDQEILNAAEKLKPARSQNPLRDLISDEHGISVLRLQMLVWTVILAATYCITLCRFLTPPVLDTELLALMGVCNTGYLSAKFTESLPIEP